MSLARGTGMVLGKFMPPHRGHQYLVEFARRGVERLTVVVEHVRNEPIPSTLRYAWMRELFPDCDVVHLQDENPQDPSEHPDFWQIWEHSLRRILPYAPNIVFASESYGPKLASVLGARFLPVDPARYIQPISGSALRRAPLEHWEYLPECVRPYFVKRICVFGPESTGKSTLTHQLAKHFASVAVPEYARTLLEAKGGAVEPSDMLSIALGQAASEEALARMARRVLFCDTDPLTTAIWSEVLFGSCDPLLLEEARSRPYDLTLLLDVDVPWVADPVRYFPEQRQAFFDRCQAQLEANHRPYVILRGNWDERWQSAVKAVTQLLEAS